MKLAEETLPVTVVQLRNVLFATDFSSASLAALPHVAAIARRYESKVYLVHVVVPEAYPLMSPEAASWDVAEMDQGATTELARLANSKVLEGIPHEALLATGEVIEALTATIKRHDIDLVVVGTHGRTGFRRFLLGSVAEAIFRHLPCPVLTVGPHASGKPLAEVELKQILYPTDLSETSFCAARHALSFALEYAAHLTVLHVESLPPSTALEAKLMADAFGHQIQTLLPAGTEAWCDLESTVERGDPAETILRVAKERAADLIVMGVRTANVGATHRPGNVAYRVVTEAGCPVLTVGA